MDYNKIQPIIEIYKAIQSEGSQNGIPHIIIRTTGCTHRCWFGEGGWCDSWYTSIHPEKGKYTLQDFKNYCEKNKYINHLMITGGSPTMHPELVNELIIIFKTIHTHIKSTDMVNSDSFITLETEGSHELNIENKIDLISLSPKFSNSVPKLGITTPQGKVVDQKLIDQHNKFRLNTIKIQNLIKNHWDYQFKPVWDGTPENLEEIEFFRKLMNIPKHKTWIMPAGDTREREW